MSAVKEVNSKSFDELIASESLSAVDFYAVWCQPCKMLAPNFEEAATAIPEVQCARINVDENMDIAKRYRINSIPCIILFRRGQEVTRSVGYAESEELVALLNKYKA